MDLCRYMKSSHSLPLHPPQIGCYLLLISLCNTDRKDCLGRVFFCGGLAALRRKHWLRMVVFLVFQPASSQPPALLSPCSLPIPVWEGSWEHRSHFLCSSLEKGARKKADAQSWGSHWRAEVSQRRGRQGRSQMMSLVNVHWGLSVP